MDSDATGFEQGGFVGECRRPVGRKATPGLAEQVAADALRRLGGPESGPLDGLAHPIAVDALEGLGDGHDRDGRPVTSGRLRDGRHQCRIDQGPRSVVDQDDAGRLRVMPIEGGEAGPDRLLATAAARDDLDDARRKPRRLGQHLAAIGRRDDDRPPDGGRRGQRLERPGEQRPPPISAASLSVPPIRLDAPAPTTITSARTPDSDPSTLNRAWAGRRSSDRPRSGARG